jgi:hypothetical protein
LTAEQLEAARAERMRQNGLGTLTLEEARTWIEETGLCLFLPRKQFTSSVAPSFVEAIAGRRDATPDPNHISAAEGLLVRLENDGVAVRLNLSAQPGDQPDFVVATWVLPYVYALRGDRDWRRNPQLTGSRAVSQLAVQAYKLLEASDATIAQLKHALGREVSESAVIRAITELWQQLRIIPVIAAPGQAAKWQLLRHRYQKAIAEGASTSQVTAISVLASIYLQAVIAASMEEVELFLAPLTARSKVREVLRGLVATRQVHTITMGHAPHFYVAGTLPEFAPQQLGFGASYYPHGYEREDSYRESRFSHSTAFVPPTPSFPPAPPAPPIAAAPPTPAAGLEQRPIPKPIQADKPAAARPIFSRPVHNRNRKPAARTSQPSKGLRTGRRPADARSTASRSPNGARTSNGARPSNSTRTSNGSARPTNGTRWTQKSNGKSDGNHAAKSDAAPGRSNGTTARPNGTRSNGNGTSAAASSWTKRNGHAKSKPASIKRNGTLARKDVRVDARGTSRNGRKPTLTAGAKAGNSKRFGFTARSNKGTKKRG